MLAAPRPRKCLGGGNPPRPRAAAVTPASLACSGPRRRATIAAFQSPDPIPPVPPMPRVLVVDDSPDTVRTLTLLLRRWGHEVATAEDGVAALTRADAFGPDAAVLDLGLPGLDGYEVARRLRARFGPGLLLVAVTGHGTERDRELSRQAAFDHHLVKPADPLVLAELLRPPGGRLQAG